MIKVNLIGASRKKPAKAAMKIAMPTSVMPVILILVALASAATGYWWYSTLSSQSAELEHQIQALDARKSALEAVIKQNQIYETRKKMLDSRVKIIEGLEKNQ